MAEESKPVPASEQTDNAEASQLVEVGKVSRWLTENGFEHEAMELDRKGVEIIKVDRNYLLPLQQRSMPMGLTISSVNVAMILVQDRI